MRRPRVTRHAARDADRAARQLARSPLALREDAGARPSDRERARLDRITRATAVMLGAQDAAKHRTGGRGLSPVLLHRLTDDLVAAHARPPTRS